MFWKKTKSFNKEVAIRLYSDCVDMVKKPINYTDFMIPDEVLGRFEALSVYLFVMLRRLKEEKTSESAEITQEIIDLFVADMDHSLRDARLSEKKIDKNFKRLIEGFYGRLVAYDTALEESSLEQAIHKNVYGSVSDRLVQSSKLADQVNQLLNKLRTQQNISNISFL